VSPREKHIPDDAKKTTVALTAEESAAINWISQSRRNRKDKRTTTNDILVDALWHFLEKTEGKTRDQIRSMVPAAPQDERRISKVTELKPKNKR
jgi:subtilase family serine protease